MKNNINIAVIKEKIENIEEKIIEFVTKTEFAPVKAITYGLVGLMAVAVIGALLKLILK